MYPDGAQVVTDDLSRVVDSDSSRVRGSSRTGNIGKLAVLIQESLLMAVGIRVGTDNRSRAIRIDTAGARIRALRVVEPGDLFAVENIPVHSPALVKVKADHHARV